jgi:hypothetical protein
VLCALNHLKATAVDGSVRISTLGPARTHSVREQEKRIPEVSYRALKARGKKICARSLLLHKQNSNIYLKNPIRYVRKEKEANVQNINSILPDLSSDIYIYRYNRIRCL